MDLYCNLLIAAYRRSAGVKQRSVRVGGGERAAHSPPQGGEHQPADPPSQGGQHQPLTQDREQQTRQEPNSGKE